GVRCVCRRACCARPRDSRERGEQRACAAAGGLPAVRPLSAGGRAISEMAVISDPAEVDRKFSPALGVFANWRLHAYGYAIAAIYAAFLIAVFRAGSWLVDSAGVPVYTDFACAWAAAVQALHGDAALLYDPAEFVKVQ